MSYLRENEDGEIVTEHAADCVCDICSLLPPGFIVMGEIIPIVDVPDDPGGLCDQA